MQVAKSALHGNGQRTVGTELNLAVNPLSTCQELAGWLGKLGAVDVDVDVVLIIQKTNTLLRKIFIAKRNAAASSIKYLMPAKTLMTNTKTRH